MPWGDARARRKPLVVSLESNVELAVEHPQVTIAVARHRLRHDGLDFLRYDPDKGLFAAVIAEAVEAKSIVEMAEQGDIVFERNVGPASAAAKTSATYSPRFTASALRRSSSVFFRKG